MSSPKPQLREGRASFVMPSSRYLIDHHCHFKRHLIIQAHQAPSSPCSALVASKPAATNSGVVNIRFTPPTLPPIKSSPGRSRLLRMAEICDSGRWSAFMDFMNPETLNVLVES